MCVILHLCARSSEPEPTAEEVCALLHAPKQAQAATIEQPFTEADAEMHGQIEIDVEAMQARHGPVCLKRLLSRTEET